MGKGASRDERFYINQLLKEAYKILEKSTGKSGAVNRKNILHEKLNWQGGNTEEEAYFKEFSKFIISMVSLDFSSRLPVCKKDNSIQNIFSQALNMASEELKGRVVSKGLVLSLLKALNVKDTLVVGTDSNGIINFLYSDKTDLFPSFDSLYYTDINEVASGLVKVKEPAGNNGALEKNRAILTLGDIGPVIFRKVDYKDMGAPEGILYIFDLP